MQVEILALIIFLSFLLVNTEPWFKSMNLSWPLEDDSIQIGDIEFEFVAKLLYS